MLTQVAEYMNDVMHVTVLQKVMFECAFSGTFFSCERTSCPSCDSHALSGNSRTALGLLILVKKCHLW